MSYFHPERMPVLPASRREAARRQLEELVDRSARIRGRRGPAVIAAAAAIVVISSVAAGVIAYHPVTNKGLAFCFTIADPRLGPAYYATVADPSRPGTKGQVQSAHDGCAALFRIGMLRKGQRVHRPSRNRHFRVPPLAVCVWHGGTAVVFPGPSGTCASLGLHPAAARRLSRLTPPAARYGGPGSLSQTGAAVP
jgi:hypothetical protein